MTSNPHQDAAFRQLLITSPGESQTVEYKSLVPFDATSDFGLKLMKHILGMANTGGGWIVIGFDDKTLQPDPSHSQGTSATYDTTRLSEAIDKLIHGDQPVRLIVHMESHPSTKVVYPIIEVKEFGRTPFISRSERTASDTKKTIILPGKVYIRRAGASTSEIIKPSEWEDLLERCVAHRRDEFLRQFSDLVSRMGMGTVEQESDAGAELHEWTKKLRDGSSTFRSMSEGSGYLQTAHMLIRSSGKEWSHQDLRDAAWAAKPQYQQILTPKASGIEIGIGWDRTPMLPEYWYLNKIGMVYASGLLREDYESPSFSSSSGRPEKALWIDLAINRIARELLDSATVSKELGVAPDEPYLLSMEHGGLRGRSIYMSSPKHLYFVALRARSQEDVHRWQGEVTRDLIVGNLVELVHEIMNSLAVVFEFVNVPKALVADIIGEYIRFRSS